jgi:hypothetical protein
VNIMSRASAMKRPGGEGGGVDSVRDLKVGACPLPGAEQCVANEPCQALIARGCTQLKRLHVNAATHSRNATKIDGQALPNLATTTPCLHSSPPPHSRSWR